MTTHYRCLNCGTEFKSDRGPDAPRPGCKACGIDVDAEPALANFIQALETIHFDPPHPIVKHRGKGHWACNPKRGVAGSRATGEPAVVNCEACRETAEWKKAYGMTGEPQVAAAHDEPVELDKARMG